ncbi:hypothetical protein ACFYZ5_39480 [Streptomyces chartreusis]|uniref:hypothetical protein n=1 Tax=Streptomyces chartreusis TaxID=1969 RepID=UPI00368802CA
MQGLIAGAGWSGACDFRLSRKVMIRLDDANMLPATDVAAIAGGHASNVDLVVWPERFSTRVSTD